MREEMARERSLVRASDIGAWSYCHRAWWLAHIKHAPHRQPALLRRGELLHARHGRQVVWALRLRRLGLLLMIAGLFLAGLALLWFLAN
jgi:hypothetical protein